MQPHIMGDPTSEIGYTIAITRRENHEVHKNQVVALGGEKKTLSEYRYVVLKYFNKNLLFLKTK